MSENCVVIQRWAVLYVQSTSTGKFSQRRIFKNYEPALEMYHRNCFFIDTHFDGYCYVALLWDDGSEAGFRLVALQDNIGSHWINEDIVDG